MLPLQDPNRQMADAASSIQWNSILYGVSRFVLEIVCGTDAAKGQKEQ